MTTPNNDEYFLMLEGLAADNNESLIKLKGVLISDFEFSVAQVTEILSSLPSPLKTSKSEEELVPALNKLEKIGAKVFILKPKDSKEKNGVPSLSLESESIEFKIEDPKQVQTKEQKKSPSQADKPATLELKFDDHKEEPIEPKLFDSLALKVPEPEKASQSGLDSSSSSSLTELRDKLTSGSIALDIESDSEEEEVATKQASEAKVAIVDLNTESENSSTEEAMSAEEEIDYSLKKLSDLTVVAKPMVKTERPSSSKEIGKEKEGRLSSIILVKAKSGLIQRVMAYNDIVLPIIFGGVLLLAANVYFFTVLDNKKKNNTEEELALVIGVDGKPVTSVAEVLPINLLGSMEDRGLKTNVSMVLFGDKFNDVKINIVGPEPRELEPEEIVTGKYRDPWLKEFIVDDLKLSLTEATIVSGIGSGYGYVLYKGKDMPIYANVTFNGVLNAEQKSLQFELKIDKGINTLPTGKNFELLQLRNNFVFAIAQPMTIDIHGTANVAKAVSEETAPEVAKTTGNAETDSQKSTEN